MLLAETSFYLKELHETCDYMGKDIETLLWSAKFSSKKEIIKYLRDKDYFDRYISCICSRLKRNCLNYSKIIRNFQKNLLEIKKKNSS